MHTPFQPAVQHFVSILLASVLVSVGGCAHTLTIPRPSPGAPGAPLPPLEPAFLEAPLVASVRETLRALEAQVPSVLDTGGAFRSLGPFPVGVRYTVRRLPFHFEAREGALHAETVLELSAEACGGVPLGISLPLLGNGCVPVADCGVHERPRRVIVATDTFVRLDPSWRVVAETRPASPVIVDRCELTPFRVDVSGFVAQLVAQEVARATASLDRDIALRGDLRPLGERLWAELQRPVDLGEGFWLRLSPEFVTAGPIALDPEELRTRVGVVARPRVGVGLAHAGAATPLPPLVEGVAGGRGFRMALDVDVSFEEATRLVGEEFRGRTMELEGHRVLLRDLRVSGHGGALLFLVDVRFEDGVFAGQTGTVHLTGLPVYDTARGELTVGALDYTLETRSALVAVGEWFLRSSLRRQLAERARFPLGARIARLRASAERALSRELVPGTRLEGRLGTVTPQGAMVSSTGVTLRVLVDGEVRVVQDTNVLGLTAMGHGATVDDNGGVFAPTALSPRGATGLLRRIEKEPWGRGSSPLGSTGGWCRGPWCGGFVWPRGGGCGPPWG